METTVGVVQSLTHAMTSYWVLFVCEPCGKGLSAVGTTELGDLERLRGEWEKRETKVFVLAMGPRDLAEQWPKDVHSATGYSVSYPILFDPDLDIARVLGLVGVDDAARTATQADNLRTVFVLGPDSRVRMKWTYPIAVGWSSFECLRALDALKRADLRLATPVNWVPGRDLFVDADVDSADAIRDFPRGLRTLEVPSGTDYIRLTPDPVPTQTSRRAFGSRASRPSFSREIGMRRSTSSLSVGSTKGDPIISPTTPDGGTSFDGGSRPSMDDPPGDDVVVEESDDDDKTLDHHIN